MTDERTHEEMLEQFRTSPYLDVCVHPGSVSIRHVQAIGVVDVAADRHRVYVVTVRPQLLKMPPFPTAEAAEAFVERARAAYGQRLN
ncbi:hypothetical protein [Deinococcus soli (ex Cha et al. 2016)]|uniref:hypothetical protein n=1 Tax=Deinococcus soli (ex Cha et al. 2016) TaxID=1309411 RepID=UPI0016682CFF|nr:hypothetical protein [Deinococcus soli (ex Cha et al. 2016)]GGB69351.1 hypothetical protein GCM10008019_26920 [Deinococcus soli (ex Cha et al. 2016)]